MCAVARDDLRQVDLTRWLTAWHNGDDAALDKVLPHFYARLRGLAGRLMQRERRDHTLQPTALVHEVYLRLIKLRDHKWRDRTQFFTACSYLMRNALVDHARRRGAAQRGGRQVRVTLPRSIHKPPADVEALLAVDDALLRLETVDGDLAELVVMRYFGGLSIPEIAALRGVSESSVKRRWWIARAWLRRELDPDMAP